jgi:potassium channel subfamily K
LIGINAISLLFGVAANISIFLVVNDGRAFLTRNRHYFLALTIFGGMIASFILVALVIGARLRPWKPDHMLSDEFAFSEAFWFAILSAGLYFVTSGFIIYTAYMLRAHARLKNREENTIQLARGHHRLMALTILFMGYILAGAAVFSRIEGWRYLDGIYWADVTILTVGFGDFRPTTHLARCLLFPYAVGGIIILFLVVFCIPRLVLDQGKSLWEVHLRDKARIKKVHQLKKKRLREKEQKVASTFGKLWRAKAKAKKEKTNALHHKEAVRSVDTFKGRSKVVQQHEEREARREAFNHMQDVLVTSARKRLFYSLFIWGSSLLFVWLGGAMVFCFAEHSQNWSYFQSVYFSFISLLAIGYGDFTLQSPAGKAFFFLWSLIAVPTMTMLVSAIVDAAGNPYILKKKDIIKSTLRKIGFWRTKKNIQNDSMAGELTVHFPRKLRADIVR